MTATPTDRLQALFAAALEREEGEREAFLRRECAGDEALLRELLALLVVDAELEGTTAPRLPVDVAAMIASQAPDALPAGVRVGPYALREEIGRART